MKRLMIVTGLLMIFIIAVAACSPKLNVAERAPAVESVQVDMEAELQDTSPIVEQKTETFFPAWYFIPMTDVNSGRVFTIKENIGKVVLVETLAAWCSNCYKQQLEVSDLHDLLGERSDFISLGIDIDPREDIPLLTGYVRKNGFDWLYVVASEEMVDEISVLYGPQYLNPPSTPMLIIDKNGNSHLLEFGIKSAQELLDRLTPFLNESES